MGVGGGAMLVFNHFSLEFLKWSFPFLKFEESIFANSCVTCIQD